MNERSKQVRRDTIKLMQQYGGTHFGGSMSCVEILIALYDHILTDNDIFILSKGHACWPYYVLLKEKGYSPRMEAHPHYDPHNGVHCTTGSLGHGLPFGLGIALAKKIKKEPGRVYVLMGDGECQEGTLWESLLIANAKDINNVTVIVDNNKLQGSDEVSNIVRSGWSVGIAPWFQGIAMHCGWKSLITDGHSITDIVKDIELKTPRPKFIMADTIKGRGISFMENSVEWHSKPLLPDLEKKALEEL